MYAIYPQKVLFQNFSLSYWFKINQWQQNQNNYWFATIEKLNQFSSELLRVSSDSASVYDIAFTLNNNSWNHLVLNFNNGFVELFINGNLAGSKPVTISPSQYPLYFGKDPGGLLEYTNGFLDDIRIYNRTLSANEVAYLAAH